MRIAFISDIHSNFEALKSVLDKIDSMKISKIYCVGDIVGYGSSCNEVIETLKERKVPSTLGNHEYGVLTGETAWFNIIAAEAIYWTIEHLKKENLDWLKSLKEKISLKLAGYKILLVHGSPEDSIWKYTFEENVDENFVRDLEYDVIVLGHTHIPFVKKIKNCLVLNCGSVGQSRDRDTRASFVVFDTKKFDAKIIRVSYDIKVAADKIIKAGLPEFLARRLYLGI